MKLFVYCPTDGTKIYIPSNARARRDLPAGVTVNCPGTCRQQYDYPRQAVFAEPSNLALGGAVAGGALGLVVGPEGAAVGALIGLLLGGSAQNADRAAAEAFNREVA